MLMGSIKPRREQVQNRREGWGEEKMGNDTVQETRPNPYPSDHRIGQYVNRVLFFSIS